MSNLGGDSHNTRTPVNSIDTGTIPPGKRPHDWVKPRWRPIQWSLAGIKHACFSRGLRGS